MEKYSTFLGPRFRYYLISILAGLSLALGLAAFAKRMLLAEILGQVVFQASGFSDVSLSVASLSLNSLTLSQAKVGFSLGGRNIHGRIEDAKIAYSIDSIKKKAVESLQVERAVLTVSPVNEIHAASLGASEFRLPKLPFSLFSINKLVLNFEGAEDALILGGEITDAKDRIYAKLSIRRSELPAFRLNIALPKPQAQTVPERSTLAEIVLSDAHDKELLTAEVTQGKAKSSFSFSARVKAQDLSKRYREARDVFKLPDMEPRGLFSGSVKVDWTIKDGIIAHQSRWKIADAKFRAGGIEFSTPKAEFKGSGIREFTFEAVEDITIPVLTLGLPFENATFKGLMISWGKSLQIAAAAVTAEALGGKVVARDLLFDSLKAEHGLSVRLEAIDLEEIAKLYQRPELQISGKVSGEIPLAITSTGISVSDGNLRADSGGYIRYTGTEAASSLGQAGENINFVHQVLRNYHFTKLEALLDYRESGKLEMDLRLSGDNPELKLGRTIEMNLHLEENLKELLKSLKVSQMFGAANR